MKVSVLGCGNVGIAISADLSLKGHDVTLLKTSELPNKIFEKIRRNENRVYLKENGRYVLTNIKNVTDSLDRVREADIVIIAIQSNYHEELIKKIATFLTSDTIVICICSYLSSFLISKYCCQDIPTIIEQTGPYLEGRVEENDVTGEIVFRVGCRLSHCHSSIFQEERRFKIAKILKEIDKSFYLDYSILETALLNPNMVLHTVGSIMSIPRIEYSHGDFCMYREAYSHDNEATIKLMLALDEEKKIVLSALGQRPIDIFEAGGFHGNPLESFFRYSESTDRAVSPTSIHSRYITEDVSQGLVLLESIAKYVGVDVPLTSSLITIASNALDIDFRKTGRTLERLEVINYIDSLKEIA